MRVIADSALGRTVQPWFLPDCGENWNYRLALAFRVSKLGKNINPQFAPRYFDARTLLFVPQADGCESLDWMDGAAVCGSWLPIDEIPEQAAGMLADVSRLATVKNGDILAFFLPQAPQPLKLNQHIQHNLSNTEVLSFNVK